MKKILLIFLILVPALLHGQNRLDEKGRKTGPWKVEFPEGGTLYEGTFIEGKPVGLMIRYYDTGEVRARITFSPDNGRNHTELLYKNGNKAAEGIFLGKEKDSIWSYYSEQNGHLMLRENYSKGKLNGTSRHFYGDGQVSEELSWKKGIKDGPWNQFYESGEPRLRGSYLENELHGPYTVYQPGGFLLLEGEYMNGLTHGIWRYYDEEGNVADSLEFVFNRAVNQEKYELLMQDSLLNITPDEESPSFLE